MISVEQIQSAINSKKPISYEWKDARLTLTKENIKLMCYYFVEDNDTIFGDVYNYVLVNANKLKISSPNKLDTLIQHGTEVIISINDSISFKCLFNSIVNKDGNKYYSLLFNKEETTLEIIHSENKKEANKEEIENFKIEV